MSAPDSSLDNRPWYAGITRYQWLVLLIASLGWVFDVFEGQIFVASMRDAMPALLGSSPDSDATRSWNDLAFGTFLMGGAVGGVVFGIMSDRVGRSKTMMITILFYSMFTCLSAFSQEPWHMVVLRFLVAMGVGGEWAVASAMVAEVMPERVRHITSSIFHASSVFGTLLAVATIKLVIANPEVNASITEAGFEPWRVGFMIGVLPALLTVWIRWKLKEPESWTAAREKAKLEGSTEKTGRLGELFSKPILRNTVVGVTLATIGMVTFWGVHIYGKNALMRQAQFELRESAGVPAVAAIPEGSDEATVARLTGEWKTAVNTVYNSATNAEIIKDAEMLSMTLNTIGGGLGLVLFGWISAKLGRKGAFILYHAMAFIMVIVVFKVLDVETTSRAVYAVVLPIFGFFTLGMHAGYAVYFPELYPTRLRGTGSGFCFNIGRLGTAAAFFGFAAFASGMTNESKALWLAPLYLLGVVVVLFGRETRGEVLPE